MLVTEGSLLNTGLVVGSERAMVIDTGCGPRQGREILDAAAGFLRFVADAIENPNTLLTDL